MYDGGTGSEWLWVDDAVIGATHPGFDDCGARRLTPPRSDTAT
jgi:hypothetical protein